jgi:hypothetical protein
MKSVYFLVKFWVLIKVAQMRLKKITVNFVGEDQEKLKNFLLGIIDRITTFLVSSHSVKSYRICRKFSNDLIDLAVGLRRTYAFPVWDNVLFYACDLKTLTYRTDRI